MVVKYLEEDSVDVSFHGTAYSLSITTYSENGGELMLGVDLESLSLGTTWHGEFPASYVEGVTGKTGSFKRFDIFVKMFQGALWRQSDTVFLDLLTYGDLVRWHCCGLLCALQDRSHSRPTLLLFLIYHAPLLLFSGIAPRKEVRGGQCSSY